MNKFKTEQEKFWAEEFGVEYIERNKSDQYLASNLNFFAKNFRHIINPEDLIEFGPNIGMNLKAIKLLFPSMQLAGVEINSEAAKQLSLIVGEENVYNTSILDFEPIKQYDVVLIKGVLIHINPEMLPLVYEKLYNTSNKYILICEYYNPSPVALNYRGYSDKLFKRDFAGEMLDKYTDLELVDYGFSYKRDSSFPQDDITWFLLKK